MSTRYGYHPRTDPTNTLSVQVVAETEGTEGEPIPTIRIRIYNYDNVTALRTLKSNSIGVDCFAR